MPLPFGGHGPSYFALPKSFVPATPMSLDPGARAGASVGTSKSTQCVNVPLGASGSSTINAKLFVLPPVTSLNVDQARAGEVLSPSQVYVVGMVPPSAKAELVTW